MVASLAKGSLFPTLLCITSFSSLPAVLSGGGERKLFWILSLCLVLSTKMTCWAPCVLSLDLAFVLQNALTALWDALLNPKEVAFHVKNAAALLSPARQGFMSVRRYSSLASPWEDPARWKGTSEITNGVCLVMADGWLPWVSLLSVLFFPPIYFLCLSGSL